MAYSFPEDNEATFFATAPDNCGTSFDNLFDLDSDYPSLDVSDTSTSHGSSSTDINFFEDLGFEAAFLADSFFTSSANTPSGLVSTAPPNWVSHQGSNSAIHSQIAPKTVRLAYRTRPESVAITGAQLMALENKDDPNMSTPLTNFESPFSIPSSATPPTTPHQSRTPGTPSRRQTHRTHPTERELSHLRPSYKPVLVSGSSKAMSSTEIEERQQAPTPSLQFAEWTERVRRLAIQSPQHSRILPLSPPPSGQIEQMEMSQSMSQSMAFEMQEDPFNHSSSTTTVSSTELTHHFLDDSSPSTIDSSWNVDAAVELFGLKQDQWDFQSIDTENVSTNSATNSSEHIRQFLTHQPNITNNPSSTIPSSGLGISIGATDLGTDPFSTILASTNPPSELDLDTPFNSNSSKLPTMPFNSPASEFCSPALSCDLAFLKTNMVLTPSSPPPLPLRLSKSAQTTPKHRRTKSASSLQFTTRRRSSSKVRTPRTPREKRSTVGGLGFVNFTPEDRTRILTGVAPSGSSKTKARREKEAWERRKKLSEAAKRLVVEAGGDGDAIDRELSE